MPLVAMSGAAGARRSRLHLVGVPPNTGRPVAARPVVQCLLAGLEVLVSTLPRLQRRILERPSVGEADLPRLRTRKPVDHVQVGGCRAIFLTTRQEHDTRHRSGYVPAQAAKGGVGDLLSGSRTSALLTRDHHV